MSDTMPTSQWCPIGSLNLHTYNYERTECIWCGPNRLSGLPGAWVEVADGVDGMPAHQAWSVYGIPGGCPKDTDGDGNCGQIACPWCGPQSSPVSGTLSTRADLRRHEGRSEDRKDEADGVT